jgi:hypothetical protein
MNLNDKDLLEKIKDPKYYLENFCKVKTKEGGLAPFKLKEFQKDLFNTLRDNKRVIILKARQMGCSTALCGYGYHFAITNPGVTVALIAYNEKLAAEFLDKIKTFINTSPPGIRPTIQYDSRFELSFPKTESKILVLSNSINVGVGYTIHFCLLSELQRWEKAEEKMVGLRESIPANGRMVIEGTPLGVGGLYHKIWTTSKEFVKKEYGWWWTYTKEEMDRKKEEIGPNAFSQEYGMKFLASGRTVFEYQDVEKQMKNVLNVGDERIFGDKKFTVYERDGWVVYKEPEKDGLYVVGVDVGGGVTGGDYSVATVFDRKTGEEVAMYRRLIAPDRFGEILDKKGREYNNALMVVEVNNHGLTTLTVLKQKIYPSIYFRPRKFETLDTGAGDRMGWRTTKVTRFLLRDDLATTLREVSVTIHSKNTIDEMFTFVYNDDGEMVTMSGFHDDAIFSIAIALQGFKIMYSGELTQLDERSYLPQNFSY